jgi:ABC transport system ATP-binding/permease protein
MWKLVIEDEEGKRTVVHLTRDDYSIGRKDGHTIRLTERNVSRDHATLKKKNGRADGRFAYLLDDLRSYNGVFVNGLRLADAQEMVHGDLIQIGDYRIIIQDDAVVDGPAVTTTVELDLEDLKSTVVPGRGRKATVTGEMLLARPHRLVMLVGPTPGEEYPLDKERITVGRAEEATVSVNHNSVSRLHCEIHRLEEGRYEIVDKGSANGVRVNGSDLSRGIVEAGDLIELGDVRFKFVGAGQVFIPNASDSQQVSAISDRQAEALSGSRRYRATGSIIPFVLVGLLLGGAAVAGVYVYAKAHDQRKSDEPMIRPSPEPAATTSANASQNEELLTAAWRERSGNAEKAHHDLQGFEPGSPLRSSEKWKDIETAWADERLRKAKSDPLHANELLEGVRGTSGVAEKSIAAIDAWMLTIAPTASPDIAPAPSTRAASTGSSASPASSGSTVPATDPATAHRPTNVVAPPPVPLSAVSQVPASAAKPPDGDKSDVLRGLLGAGNFSAGRGLCQKLAARGLNSEERLRCNSLCKGEIGMEPDKACKAAISNAPPR